MNTNLGKSSRVLSGMMKRWVHIPKSIIRYHTIYHRIIVVCIEKFMRENGCYLIPQNLPQNTVDIWLSTKSPTEYGWYLVITKSPTEYGRYLVITKSPTEYGWYLVITESTSEYGWYQPNHPKNMMDILYHEIYLKLLLLIGNTKTTTDIGCCLVLETLTPSIIVVW